MITKQDDKEKKMKKLMILEEELELIIEKKQKRIKKKIMKKREKYIKYLGDEKNKQFKIIIEIKIFLFFKNYERNVLFVKKYLNKKKE